MSLDRMETSAMSNLEFQLEYKTKEVAKLQQEISALNKQIEFLNKRDEMAIKHYNSVRELYNKELRKLNTPEIRMLLAKKAEGTIKHE
jgi:hypothetical protein